MIGSPSNNNNNNNNNNISNYNNTIPLTKIIKKHKLLPVIQELIKKNNEIELNNNKQDNIIESQQDYQYITLEILYKILNKKVDVLFLHDNDLSEDLIKKCNELNEYLKQFNLITSFDRYLYDKYTIKKYIENTRCIILLISNSYLNNIETNDKNLFRLSFLYALKQKSNKCMIPLILEENIWNINTGRSFLGIRLESQEYINFTSINKINKKSKYNEVYKNILVHINNEPLQVVLQHQIDLLQQEEDEHVYNDIEMYYEPVDQMILEWRYWFIKSFHIPISKANTYTNIILNQAEVGDISQLIYKLQINSNLLTELGFDEYDSDQIIDYLNNIIINDDNNNEISNNIDDDNNDNNNANIIHKIINKVQTFIR